MSGIIYDVETDQFIDLDDVTFNDELQTISKYIHGQDGFPCSTLELIEDRKEYFKRKLKGM